LQTAERCSNPAGQLSSSNHGGHPQQHGSQFGRGAEPSRVRGLCAETQHPADPEGLYRPAVRQPPGQPHRLSARVFPETRAGEWCRKLRVIVVFEGRVLFGVGV